jgi:hypothetical protein
MEDNQANHHDVILANNKPHIWGYGTGESEF